MSYNLLEKYNSSERHFQNKPKDNNLDQDAPHKDSESLQVKSKEDTKDMFSSDPNGSLLGDYLENQEVYINLFPQNKGSQLDIQLKPSILFPPKHPDFVKFSNYGSFGIIKCDNITTYFLGQVACSQFTFPATLEADERLDIFILYRGEKSLSNSMNLKTNTSIFQLDPEFSPRKVEKFKVLEFLNSLNEFFYENQYVELVNSLACNKVIFYTLLVFLICLIGIFLFFGVKSGLEYKEKKRMLMIGIFSGLVIICSFLLKFIIHKICFLPFNFLEGVMSFRIKNVHRLEGFIEKWNEKLFISKGVKIWCPASLDYVIFNYDINQNIQIQSHCLNEAKPVDKKSLHEIQQS